MKKEIKNFLSYILILIPVLFACRRLVAWAYLFAWRNPDSRNC